MLIKFLGKVYEITSCGITFLSTHLFMNLRESKRERDCMSSFVYHQHKLEKKHILSDYIYLHFYAC
jgi:hypothetical protein